MFADPGHPWHAAPVEEAFAQLESTRLGLDEDEAAIRFLQFGANRLKPASHKSALKRFFTQFHNVLIYVLIGSGLITLLLAHWVDSSVIFGVVLINAIIGFIQEGKAEKAMEAIKGMLSQQAMVMRDGTLVPIAAEQLVPGDIVVLQSGDRVPADMRLFHCRELRIDEAMLTGESFPSEKSSEAVATDAAIGDRECMAYSGTLVTYGQGSGIVTGTGDQTEIGRISRMLRHVETLTTPLMRQLARFAMWLSIAISAIAVATFAYGVLFHGYSASTMFLAAVGLAVAGIPEGLPAIMTITLAIGVQRMAAKQAIIRRLPAVETLGSVTVICSDKTGTLTRNEMTAQTLMMTDAQLEISGSGYDPHGSFSMEEWLVTVEHFPQLAEIARASLLCNDTRLLHADNQWQLQGDPTEGALLTLALKAGLDQETCREQYPRIDAIPFESEHRFMATMHHDHANHRFIYVKGAPERILQMCISERSRGSDLPLDHDAWHRQLHQMVARGQRLLALAFKTMNREQQSIAFADVESGLTLLGIVGIIDPPRSEAIAAVARCHTAGIRVKMITGDHAGTAAAVGQQIGIYGGLRGAIRGGIGDATAVITGHELEQLDDEALRETAFAHNIFARVSPEQKLKLVMALQASGEVVAMTGDGVNDAPALKRADVGVAMGLKGTEVARESAEMVLADDNFASIASAVEEGRTVYDNLRKSILFILPTNGGEALTIIAAIVMAMELPITAAQILWVNMITAVTLALSLAFEPMEPRVMRRQPRDPAEPLLSAFLGWRILLVSIVLVAGTFGLFLWESERGASIELARTVAVNTLVMFEIFYLFSSRHLYNSSLNREGFTGNRYVLIAIGSLLLFQLAFTYLPPMQLLFDTTALPVDAWLRITLVASTVLFIVEFEKWCIRRYKRWQRHRHHTRNPE